MKLQKFSRQEKKENKRQQVETALSGEGLYLYRNNTQAEMSLPRPTKSGLRTIKKGQEFQGDNYYMQMVRNGLLRLVREIQSPEQERMAMENIQEQKLILDQPDTITEQGHVERVVNKTTPKRPLREADADPQDDVLLNEDPVTGGFVVID